LERYCLGGTQFRISFDQFPLLTGFDAVAGMHGHFLHRRAETRQTERITVQPLTDVKAVPANLCTLPSSCSGWGVSLLNRNVKIAVVSNDVAPEKRTLTS
jgi:hypothetical protein